MPNGNVIAQRQILIILEITYTPGFSSVDGSGQDTIWLLLHCVNKDDSLLDKTDTNLQN